MTTLIPKINFKNGGSTPTGAVNRAINLKLEEMLSVLDFGADPTGVSDSSSAIQAAHDASTTLGYPAIYFPAGIYKVNTGLNWSPFVTASTTGRVVINTDLTTGTLFHISAEFGNRSISEGQQSKSVFNGTFTFIATQNDTTCVAMAFGTLDTDANKMAWGIDVSNVVTQNFWVAVTFLNVSFLIKFYNCDFLGSYDATQKTHTYGIYQATALTNAGENISFYGCVFERLNYAIADNSGTSGNFLEITFNVCSFDYNNSLLASSSNHGVYKFNDCHFEWSGTQTLFNIVGASVVCRDCLVYIPPGGSFATPIFASVNSISTNVDGLLNISGTKWVLPTSCPGLIFISSTTTTAIVESKPDFTFGYTPTYYIQGVTNAPINYNVIATANSYTPTWGASSAPSLGNGTIVGKYTQTGNMVAVEIVLTMGSTTTYGSGGYSFTLPVQAANNGVMCIGNWIGNNYGVQTEYGFVEVNSNGTAMTLFNPTGTAIIGPTTSTSPHTWKNQDTISISVQYQCVMP